VIKHFQFSIHQSIIHQSIIHQSIIPSFINPSFINPSFHHSINSSFIFHFGCKFSNKFLHTQVFLHFFANLFAYINIFLYLCSTFLNNRQKSSNFLTFKRRIAIFSPKLVRDKCVISAR